MAGSTSSRTSSDDRQHRFGLSVDHLEAYAQLAVHPIAKIVAVRRGAAGFGRNQPRARRPLGDDLVAADAQSAERAVDGCVRNPPGLGDALAKPDDARKGIDDAKPGVGRAGDQQPAVVGAEIERCIRRVIRITADLRARRAVPVRLIARHRALARPRLLFHLKILQPQTLPSGSNVSNSSKV
jgi:hypothetical protein